MKPAKSTPTLLCLMLFYSTTMFAQENRKLANEWTFTNGIELTPSNAYYRAFQVISFHRRNGNIALHIEKSHFEQVKILVYNTKGERIYENKLPNHTLFTKQFDLSAQPKGSYRFEVVSRSKLYTKEITIK